MTPPPPTNIIRVKEKVPVVVVVVYNATIVAIGHGLLKKFWPFWY